MGVRVGIGCWGRTGDSLLGGCAQVVGLDVVPLLPGIAGLPLLGIGAGVGVYVGGPLLGAVAGCHCWG